MKPIFFVVSHLFQYVLPKRSRIYLFSFLWIYNDQSLCYKFTQIYFIKSSNDKTLLSTILTNQNKKYLFPTFIIPKCFKFCIQFNTNPMENTMVSKWNLNKNEYTFLCFHDKLYLFILDIFSSNFLYKIPYIHHLIRK